MRTVVRLGRKEHCGKEEMEEGRDAWKVRVVSDYKDGRAEVRSGVCVWCVWCVVCVLSLIHI